MFMEQIYEPIQQKRNHKKCSEQHTYCTSVHTKERKIIITKQ